MGELAAMRAAGIDRFRLSPHSGDMVASAALFRDVLEGRLDAAAGVRRLALLHPALPFANGFWHAAPGHQFASPVAPAGTT
jgi:collagenase-like PrtC family protease